MACYWRGRVDGGTKYVFIIPIKTKRKNNCLKLKTFGPLESPCTAIDNFDIEHEHDVDALTDATPQHGK